MYSINAKDNYLLIDDGTNTSYFHKTCLKFSFNQSAAQLKIDVLTADGRGVVKSYTFNDENLTGGVWDVYADLVNTFYNTYDVVSISNKKKKTLFGEITRPANTTTYNTNAVVNSTVAAIGTFGEVTDVFGGSGWITRLKLQKSTNVTTAASFRIHLFHTAPTAIADNSPYTLLYENKDKRIGYVDVTLETEGTGSDSAWKAVFGTNIPFVCASDSKSLYWVLEAKAAYTPGNAEKFYCEIVVDPD